MLNFTTDTTDRLDKFLASKVEVSRSRVQKAIKNGKVTVDGIIILDPDFNVTIGNQIEMPEFDSEELKASTLELKVVFENADLAVIDKPAGMVVHPGAGNLEDTMAQALLTRFPEIRNVGEPHRPGIVHRLDEDTSGLIVVARTPAAFDFLKKTFLDRRVEKEYLTLVNGIPSKKHDLIDLPIQRVPLKQKMKIGLGKPAQTEYWVLKTSEGEGPRPSPMGEARPTGAALQFSLLRVKLHTGRTHQIRVHLAHIGHPIVGDALYGQKSNILNRQFLHAYRLKFQLLDGTWLELESPLPEDLQNLLNKLGITYDHHI